MTVLNKIICFNNLLFFSALLSFLHRCHIFADVTKLQQGREHGTVRNDSQPLVSHLKCMERGQVHVGLRSWNCPLKHIHVIKVAKAKMEKHPPFLVTAKYDTFGMSPSDSVGPVSVCTTQSPGRCYYVLSVQNYPWIMILFPCLYSSLSVSSASPVWAAFIFLLGFLPCVPSIAEMASLLLLCLSPARPLRTLQELTLRVPPWLIQLLLWHNLFALEIPSLNHGFLLL